MNAQDLLMRLTHSLYLLPAILLLMTWIVACPSLVANHYSVPYIAGFAVGTAAIIAWCITLFVHAVMRDAT